MLNKRTNILFDENLWNMLTALAISHKKSVGELVRSAVKKVYIDEKREKREKAFSDIQKLKKGIGSISVSEIKELIAYGRK